MIDLQPVFIAESYALRRRGWAWVTYNKTIHSVAVCLSRKEAEYQRKVGLYSSRSSKKDAGGGMRRSIEAEQVTLQ
jgi:hypothetical protein